MSAELVKSLRRAIAQMTPRGLEVMRAQRRVGFRDMPLDFWARLSDAEVAEIADAPETDMERFECAMDELQSGLRAFVDDVLDRPLPYILAVLAVSSAAALVECLVGQL